MRAGKSLPHACMNGHTLRPVNVTKQGVGSASPGSVCSWFRCHPDEDQEIGKSPFYLKRELARNWKAVKASDLAVVTLTEEAQVDPPARMRTRIVQPTADEAWRFTEPHVQLTATQYSEACVNELETLLNEPVRDSSSHSINDYPLPARSDFYRIKQALQLQTSTRISDLDRPFWEGPMHERYFH